MYTRLSLILRPMVVLVLLGSVAACSRTAASVAAVGAAAAAAITLTDQGAEGTVAGTLADVDRRTQVVLRDMGITVIQREQEQNGYEYRGTRGEMNIGVQLTAGGNNTTQVEVSAREGMLDYDKSYARSIVERIVQQR